MAEKKKLATKKVEDKKPKVTKKTQTVRERADKAQKAGPGRTRRIKTTAGRVATPLKKVRVVGNKEYHLPLPDNKVGRFLGKRGRLTPRYFRDAWVEIRQVTWPNRHETIRLTIAVFIFAAVFAVIVGLLDYGLDKIFRQLIINNK